MKNKIAFKLGFIGVVTVLNLLIPRTAHSGLISDNLAEQIKIAVPVISQATKSKNENMYTLQVRYYAAHILLKMINDSKFTGVSREVLNITESLLSKTTPRMIHLGFQHFNEKEVDLLHELQAIIDLTLPYTSADACLTLPTPTGFLSHKQLETLTPILARALNLPTDTLLPRVLEEMILQTSKFVRPLGPPRLDEINSKYLPHFYKLEKEGRPPVYILGTNHIVPLESYPKDVAQTAFDVDVLVDEINSNESKSPDERIKSLSALKIEGFVSEKDLDWYEKLSPRIQAILEKRLPHLFKVANGRRFINRLYPAAVGYLLEEQSHFAWRGEDAGVDEALWQYFNQKQRPIVALETATDRGLSQLVNQDKVAEYKNRFDSTDISKTEEEIEKLDRAIEELKPKSGSRFWQVLEETAFQDNPSREDLSTSQRNKLWTPRIQSLIDREYKDKSILIKVGSAHLEGPTGILKLLEKEGYLFHRLNAP